MPCQILFLTSCYGAKVIVTHLAVDGYYSLFSRDSQWCFLLSLNMNYFNTPPMWQVREFPLLYVRHATESRRVNLAKRHGHRAKRVYSMHINKAVNHDISLKHRKRNWHWKILFTEFRNELQVVYIMDNEHLRFGMEWSYAFMSPIHCVWKLTK